jgi:hypothetical protein
MRVVVMGALGAQVLDERLRVCGSEGLGPIAADHDPAVCAWRKRMQTDEAKRVMRARASLCELGSAHLKTPHGVAHVLVRGIRKVTCVALLAGLAANLVQHAAALLA